MPSSRAERKRAQRVERLERTAARIFAEKGYDGANFDLIAAELDLRGPSLYHYFSSKEELFLRCVQKSGDEVFARLRAIATATEDLADRLRALFREQVLIEVRDYPEFVPLFFKTSVPIAELRETVLRIRREHAAIFEEAARRVADRHGIGAAELRLRLGIAFGALAYLPEWYDPRGALAPEELADQLADLLAAPFLSLSPA
ncbi:TetR/AcrR family transcriptional regulator [Amycolatopsis alkalitolerans]|uniref:TetR/AcrR family transcriptional regulator n=1 Tax=Amycolatopsis alkalitolerans TaxID=2547244 RepID=UPI001358E6A1|nr:TetR/AcrR family transcriptional regulator [Amycolatopsis alkalitolerans]